MRFRQLRWAALVALPGVLVLPTAKADPGVARPGCDSTRPATAYGPDGGALTGQEHDAPIPCQAYTGYATIENHLAVTNDNTLVFEPAIVTPGVAGTTYAPGAPGPRPYEPLSHAGIVLSGDQGRSWNFKAPLGTLYSPNDNAVYVDPQTGRLFMGMLAADAPSGGDIPPEYQPPGNFQLLASKDSGESWVGQPLPGFVLSENSRFTSARPPAAGTQTAGYANVTYWCGNQNVGFTSPVIVDRTCFRSLDGGTTWERRAILFSNVAPQHSECGTTNESFTAGDGNYPEGASDGSLYTMVTCGSTYLARSTDEAGTFPVIHDKNGPVTLPIPAGAGRPELRVTQSGGDDVLVLTYTVAAAVKMTTAVIPSGLTTPLVWSTPAQLTPKTLLSVDRWDVATRDGAIAVSVLGSEKVGSAATATYNGYISYLTDVLHPASVWVGMVNAPDAPLSQSAPKGARDDFISVTIGPDGTPWAGFFVPCTDKDANDPACESAWWNGQRFDTAPSVGGNDRSLAASLRLPR